MLGARIAALRRSNRWSQAELATRLGVSPSAIGMYEQGRREPSGELLIAMAEMFCVSTDYLLTGKAEPPAERSAVDKALLTCLDSADAKLCQRSNRPFSRQELMVLMTALLLDA